uniref:Uncharacterized protein n=1 Tax=Populus trichocarpa TaxID=3694 RepID=A0A2K1WVI2_POPTR
MNKLFHRKRRKLAIRYQLPKEGHASELYREHLIPFNSLYTQKKKHLQQQNHSISYDFVFKWQYNPRKGTKKCSINMVQTKTCRKPSSLSILLQVLTSIYSIVLSFFLLYAKPIIV